MTNRQVDTVAESTASKRYTIIWVGFLVGLGFYVADIVIDVFVFGNGTLIEQLTQPTHHETWMRVCVLLVAVAFAVYVQILLGRERAANAHVKRTEKFLGAVIDNIPSMIFIKDARDLRFIRINRTGEKLLGLSNEELMGKSDYDFFSTEQADYFTTKDREVLASDIEVDISEEEIDTVALGKRWLHTRKVPILDEANRPLYLLGISDDITDAKQTKAELRETEIRFETLFNSAADSIFVIDREGTILQTNRFAYEHSGYDEHEFVGHNIREFFSNQSQRTCDCNFPLLRKQGFSRADIEFVCKDGRVLKMECMATGVPSEDGHFASFLIIQRDVTEKKQAEEDVQRRQQEMAHVMRVSIMGEMASGLAHELNQPLAALVSYCGTASSMLDSLPSEAAEVREILDRAKTEAHRAARIIRNLRQFVSKGENEKEAVVLDRVIDEVSLLIKPELRRSAVEIEQDLGGGNREVMANKVQVEQVLVNLIRNSIDAIRAAGTAHGRVVVQTRWRPNDTIEVTVTDNGPGIDPDMVGTLFQPFQTNKSSGMGLGLSISRSIIEAHGGRIWVDAEHRNGARFGFSLAAAAEA